MARDRGTLSISDRTFAVKDTTLSAALRGKGPPEWHVEHKEPGHAGSYYLPIPGKW